MGKADIRALSRRMTDIRAGLLRDRPFYGRLLLHLQFGYAPCGTAYTDMRHIVFDPAFAESLRDEELRFVLLHELMHCVLHHCTRGKNLQRRLYNIACDIVVNSLILESMNLIEFQIDGEPVMHLTPDMFEGRHYSAEQVYEMLLRTPEADIEKRYGVTGFDMHDIWQELTSAGLTDAWGQYVREAAAAMGNHSGVPIGLQRHLGDIYHTPRTNWRQLLQDFIRQDRSDFTYMEPDRRYQGDIIFPSFQDELFGNHVDRLWFLIDTSGSVSDETLTEAFSEIRGAVEQIGSLSGELSFFDAAVTDPIPFESAEESEEILPVGGGGTSFHAIFRYLRDHYSDDLPKAIIILTDGYARFPEENAAMDVPVMWIILDTDVEAPWGECIHIYQD